MPEPTRLEVHQLRQRLHADFAKHLPPGRSGSPEERERNFLSRALAAFTIQNLAGCSAKEASSGVVDGGGDGGIDAVYYAAAAEILWVVQSKFMASGRGEPDLGSVAKFRAGVEHLLDQEFDAFAENAALAARLPELQSIFRGDTLQVRAVLVYSGVNVVSADRHTMLSAVKRRFRAHDYFDYRCCSLTTVHDWVSGADQRPGVAEAEITVLDPGWVQGPYETVYGRVAIREMVQLYWEYGSRLVAANIRAYKGNTVVNREIESTYHNEPAHFFYLNNGLTAYCDTLQVVPADHGNLERKRVRVRGFSIVNGAQTLGSVARTAARPDGAADDGYVFVRIVSLAQCPDDLDFARRITQSTNFQNQINPRDFVALDDQQERIASLLRLEGIGYHYRADADQATEDATNFTVREASLALAALEWDGTGDLCAKATGDAKALFSTEPIYEPPTPPSRYHRLFPPERAARVIWRAVQARRLVVTKMRDDGRAAGVGVRNSFFENARAVVLSVVFVRLRPEQGEAVALTSQEMGRITGETISAAEALWSACVELGYVGRNAAGAPDPYEQTRHFRSVFSSAADCKRLRAAALSRLARD